MDYGEMKRYLSSRVQERLGYVKDVTDEEVEAVIDEVLLQERELIVWPVALRRRLQKEIFDSLRRLDILQIFVEDADITEIMINGPEQIFVEKNGQIQSLDIHFDSSERLLGVIQQIVAGCN